MTAFVKKNYFGLVSISKKNLHFNSIKIVCASCSIVPEQRESWTYI